MNANQQPKEDLGKLGSEKQPWTEAWELVGKATKLKKS
jgi:hypothetical protein